MDESLVFGESTVENTTGATNENSTGAASEELTDATLQEGDAYAESGYCSSVFVGNSLYVFFRYYEVLASPST